MSTEDLILAVIVEHIAQVGYPPSIRDIALAVGLRSSSVVHYHLTTLEQRGRISRDPRIPRGMRVLAQGAPALIDEDARMTT